MENVLDQSTVNETVFRGVTAVWLRDESEQLFEKNEYDFEKSYEELKDMNFHMETLGEGKGLVEGDVLESVYDTIDSLIDNGCINEDDKNDYTIKLVEKSMKELYENFY